MCDILLLLLLFANGYLQMIDYCNISLCTVEYNNIIGVI